MNSTLRSLVSLLLLSAAAAAQKKVPVCFVPTPWAADGKLKPIHKSGTPDLYRFDEHSGIQILHAKIDLAQISPPPELLAHQTALVSEEEIRPYRPLRALMYCQIADVYPDGSNAFH